VALTDEMGERTEKTNVNLSQEMVHEVNNNRVFTVKWNLKSLRRVVSPKHHVNQRWHL